MTREKEQEDPILLLLGGNLGDVEKNGEWVIAKLSESFKIERCSSWYSSPSWGFDGPDFLNCVVELSGVSSPVHLLDVCQHLEQELGRERSGIGYSNRPMDIDILYFGSLVILEQRLTIPHPKIQERRFTLAPLNEHWSTFVHPVLQKSQERLLDECTDKAIVTRVSK